MSSIHENEELTRSDFMRGLVTAGAGALAVAALGACSSDATEGGEDSATDEPDAISAPETTDESEEVAPVASSALAQALAFDPEAMPPAAKRVAFLAGSWHDMGRQYADQYPDSVARFLSGGVFTEEDFTWFQENTPEVADYLAGMAESFGLTPEDLYPLGTPVGEGHHCSSSAAWGSATVGGRLLVAANHDTLATDDYYDPILVAWPEDGYPFMVSSGVQGNLSMNDQGLVLTGSSGQNAAEGDIAVGLPAMLEFPVLAAKAANVEEVAPLYDVYTGCYSSNYNMNDVDGGHLVIERSNSHSARREPGDFGEKDYLITTNDFMCEEMLSSLLPAGSGYDDCRPRYYTEEHVIKAAKGEANLDTMADAMSVDNGYYDENDQWHDVSWDFGDFGLYAPENVSPWFHCFEKTLADPENLTMYVMNGCRNAYQSWLPEATGNFVHVKLAETPEEVVEAARADANYLIYDAGADVASAGDDREAKEAKLNEAKEAYVAGENLYAAQYEATDEEERYAILARACSEYLRAQAAAQLACADTTAVVRPLLFND